ncbi:hypothetical protein EUGRSUZ_K01404 [Eucalyptus grandis]|uniref:RPM1 interacting protein 13 n=2 Tax=Eucalyptus grandis TaxID=71139 RepID=A0A059A1I6_EUCGR|nr:hypothetical protein EUGRSUZ_K01404 [Eucalyptus grandis]
MDPSDGGHVVLDISSDEEGLVPDVPRGFGGDDEWISRLLRDDPDEVVLVKEVNAKSKSDKFLEDDDDDDCVVLDGDPEKSVSVSDDAADGGSDDLLIVGEKGQVACRDYPHPRHDCVKFPFSSTLHEKYCNLCHCYVCDSPAPCAYWGEGLTDVDHCHANDKQEKWKVCRKNFMQGKTTMPVPSFFHDPFSAVLPQTTQALPPINTPLPTNSIPQNLVPRPPMIFQPCSSPNRSSFSSNIHNSRKHHPGHVSRSRLQPRSSSEQLHQAHHVIQKDRVHRDSHLGPHLVSPIMPHKRTGTVGSSLAVSRAACGPNNINCPSYLPPPTNSIHNTIVNRNHIRRQNVPSSLNQVSSTNLSSCSPNLTGVPSIMTPSQASSDGQGSNQSLSEQNIHQHHSEPSAFLSFSDSLDWIERVLQDDIPPAPPAVESIHVPSTEPANEAQPAREFDTAVAGSFDIGTAGVDLGNWWSENPPPENNLYPAGIDSGMLYFDFETSWNSVTQS